MTPRCNEAADFAASRAIAHARRRGAIEVTPDDLLAGCLLEVARFGIVDLGPVVIDLDEIALLWRERPGDPLEGSRGAKVSYSVEAVQLFDSAASLARSELPEGRQNGPSVQVCISHLMASVQFDGTGLAGELEKRFGVTGKMLRTALARQTLPVAEESVAARPEANVTGQDREYLSPEEAAQALGVHVQTLRAYVRSGKLPALRLAGERAIRIRREDLSKLLEPLQAEA